MRSPDSIRLELTGVGKLLRVGKNKPHVGWQEASEEKRFVWAGRRHTERNRRRGRTKVFSTQDEIKLFKKNKSIYKGMMYAVLFTLLLWGVLMWQNNNRINRIWWATGYMRGGWAESGGDLGEKRQFPEQEIEGMTEQWGPAVFCRTQARGQLQVGLAGVSPRMNQENHNLLPLETGGTWQEGARWAFHHSKLKQLKTSHVFQNYSQLWKHFILHTQNSNHIISLS